LRGEERRGRGEEEKRERGERREKRERGERREEKRERGERREKREERRERREERINTSLMLDLAMKVKRAFAASAVSCACSGRSSLKSCNETISS
jgi:hypothetical protein